MNGLKRNYLSRFWREDGVFIVLMISLFALRFWPAFLHGALYAPFRDNIWLYGSLFSRASEIAATGDFPYWIDTVLGGFPLYQTPHFSATYPFYFLGWLNYGKDIGALYTLSYLTCLHTLILYLNLYIMLRVAGTKGLASLCGATIGLVSGNTEIYSHWITVAAAYSWLPLLVAGTIRLLRAPLAFGSIALFSAAAALICTASPAQPVIQSALFCIIFCSAGIVWRWRKDGRVAAGHLFLGLIVSGTVAAALAAVAFLPMTLATGGMIRHGPRPPIIGHASIPWNSFNVSQASPRMISHTLFDSSDLGVIGGLYVGPLALLGLLPCVIAYRRGDRFTRFLLLTSALMALYFFLAGFGTHFGLSYLHFHIPLLNRIREAARYFAVYTMLIALLAGFGFQVIVDIAEGKVGLSRPWQRYFWIVTALGLLVFILALIFDRHEKITGWLVLAVAPLALILLPASSRWQRALVVGLVLLAGLASTLAPPGVMPFCVSEYLRADNLASHRVLRRVAQLPDIANYRVVILDTALTPPTWGDNASYYGIRTFYLNFTPQPYEQFREMFPERAVNLRKMRGAKYFICGQSSLPFDSKAQLLFAESGYRVYEAADALGPYAFVHDVKAFTDKTSFQKKLASGFDYHHVAALPEKEGQTIIPPNRATKPNGIVSAIPNDTLDLIVRTPNVYGIEVDSDRAGLLILNERWSTDWHARVDALPTKVIQANFVQPAVALQAGRHYVEFEYKPMLFWYLLILQRITFLVLLLLGARKLFTTTWNCTEARSGIEPSAS